MIDTHTHLYMENYSADGLDGCVEAVDRAVAAGVGIMILPSVDRDSSAPIAELKKRRPAATHTAIGLHPTEVETDWRDELEEIAKALLSTHPVAIGEAGIDLHWRSDNISEQKEAFIAQLKMGADRDLPVIIHCRDGLEECCECIEKARTMGERKELSTLIFHSFTGTPEDVRRIREVCDPYFGINGVVTFKNSGRLPEAVKEIGIDRILLETDAPFLSPVPKRGQRNESAYIPYINDKIAEVLDIAPEEVAAITTCNAKQIFKI